MTRRFPFKYYAAALGMSLLLPLGSVGENTLAQVRASVLPDVGSLPTIKTMSIFGDPSTKMGSAWNTANYTDSDNGITGNYYSFDYGPAHFTAINTNDTTKIDPATGIGIDQLSWVKADLDANQTKKWKIGLMHKGFFDSDAHCLNLAGDNDYDIPLLLVALTAMMGLQSASFLAASSAEPLLSESSFLSTFSLKRKR